MIAAKQLAAQVGVKQACLALGIPRATYYRQKAPAPKKQAPPKRSPLALSILERQAVLNVLHSDRFVDKSPGEIVPTLLDEGRYLCSERTMYRILSGENEIKERRQRARHSHLYAKPELLATAPNQVWSWDITKLKGARTWSYYYLYVIIDIYSRCVVGWMVADRESAVLAERLIESSYKKQGIKRDQLTLHADRGSSMKSKVVAHLLSDLGVTKTHNRPYTSNDNPFSEAQFKTLKYCPGFPERFGCIEDARAFSRAFFKWYNDEHRHSGINRLTPSALHYGEAGAVLKQRNKGLAAAFAKNPNRFKNKKPTAGDVPTAVWINPPEEKTINEIKERKTA